MTDQRLTCGRGILLCMTNPSFTARLAAAYNHERRVADALRDRGWTVDHWGQGVLSEPIKDAMWRGNSRLRFLPDLIAARDGDLMTIDCKDRLRSTTSGRYAIKRESVNFGLQLAALGVPMFYVFGNLGVLLPTEVMSYGHIGPRVAGGGAYYLVGERLAHEFDDVFGGVTGATLQVLRTLVAEEMLDDKPTCFYPLSDAG